MTRRALALTLLATLTLTLTLAEPSGALRAAPPEPMESALVTMAAPSVASVAAQAVAATQPGAAAPLAQPALAPSILSRAAAAVARAQAPVLAAAARLGVTVAARYDTALDALLVHGTARQLAALARAPGVVAVEPAPLVWPALARAVPYIGAKALTQATGYAGDGVVVAVIDTGLDYTHADFGGPGVSAAFEAANSAPDIVSDSWDGVPLFPTAKVIGGEDFVGSRYTSAGFCSMGDEQAGRCTSTLHPDPDPLDERSGNWADGHGTHVAGIVAGLGAGVVPPGVAPQAKLVSLKVFGLPAGGVEVDTPSDVLVSAFEWCVRVNMGLPVAGTAPPHVDVINMSLGGYYDAGGTAYRAALAAARDSGIVIVAAAGNEGDHAFIANGPGTAPEALGVASTAIPAGAGYDPLGRAFAGISNFSARGPGANGTLKPDLTAPGEGILSAGFATGNGARSISGTSMATPMVAGAAALLVQRNRAEALGLGARDLAALLMNQSAPGVLGWDGRPAPMARQGAGLVDVFRSGTATFVATAGDTASLDFGAVSLTGPLRLSRDITVRNLSTTPRAFRATFAYRDPDDEGRGVTVTLPAGPILVPGGGSATVPVTVDIDPAGLPPPALEPGASQVDEYELTNREVDGQVLLAPQGDGGPAPADPQSARVPLYLLPRAASAIAASARAADRLHLVNPGPANGTMDLFVVPDGAPIADPDEPDIAGPLDVRYVAAAGDGTVLDADVPPMETFGIALAAPLPVPELTSFEIYVDTDRDGRIDYRIRSGPTALFDGNGDPETMEVRVARWDADAGAPLGDEQATGMPYAVDVYSRLAFVTVPRASIGLSADAAGPAFAFYLVHRGLNERWRPGPELDVVPDGADLPGGARFVAAPSPAPRWPVDLTVPAGGSLDLHLADAYRGQTLLALSRLNRFEPEGGQVALIPPGAVVPPPAVYLPFAARH